MTSPKFSFSTNGVPSALWPNVLGQIRLAGTPGREHAYDFTAAVDSYAFCSTTMNFWTLDKVRYERTKQNCAQSPNNNYALCLVDQGSAKLDYHDQTFPIQKGDCSLFNLDDPFRLTETDKIRFRALRISKGLVASYIPSPQMATGKPLTENSDWANALVAVLRTLTPERVCMPCFSQQSVLENILFLLSLAIDPTELVLKNSKATMLERFRRSIGHRFHEPDLSPAKVAEEHGVSTRTFFSVFACAKSSFGHELMSTRMDHAIRMLNDPRFDSKSIAEIGHMVGFSHATHFTTSFRKSQCISPSAFRTSRQKNAAGG